jgi:RES domain-containing protein
MKIWRLDKRRYAEEAFRGKGALRTSGRWHREGAQVAYASEHPGVAALEKLVWLESYERAAASDYVLLSLRVDPDRHVERIRREDLPDGWNAFPHAEATKRAGMRWLGDERSVVLEVPSAVIPVAKNYLVNPFHPHFHELERPDPEPFSWDSRLFRGGPKLPGGS